MIPTDQLGAAKQVLLVLLPEWILLATAIVMMTAGAFVRLKRSTWSITAAGALVVALVALVALGSRATEPYASVALNDALAFYSRLVFLFTGLILIGLAHDQVDDPRAAEFFGALLMIFAGAMLVAAANELVFLFVGLELVSIPTYLLLYLPRRTTSTQEAATKYFFLSVFSSALLLFGLAYLYGQSGISNLKGLAYLAQQPLFHPSVPLGLIALVFVTAGLGFRVAAVPFHFYAPDVYQGSPTVLAALLAWVPKGVGFLALLRTLTAIFGGSGLAGQGMVLVGVIAVATMVLGNTVALLQENLKRLLAYSSIAHAGYLMIGVAVAFGNRPFTGDGPEPDALALGSFGILFYLLSYALMTLGAFGIIIALSTPERPVETVADLAGLGRTRPWLALLMTICLFSLAGVPPLAGFYGKFYIFTAALFSEQSEYPGWLWTLAIIGVLNAAIGAYYYLKIVMAMYFQAPAARAETRVPIPWPTLAAVTVCGVLTLIIGFPEPIVRAARQAAVSAVRHDTPAPATEGPVTATVFPASRK